MLRLLKAALLILLIPPLAWLVIIVFNVRVPLSALGGPLSSELSSSLGRSVHFTGDIILTPTLVPALEISEVSIDNPEGVEGSLLRLGRVFLEFELVSLLSRELVIKEVQARRVSLDLRVLEDGRENWLLGPPVKTATESATDSEVRAEPADGTPDLVVDIGSVRFEDIRFSYQDEVSGTQLVFNLDMLEGRMRWQEDILLEGIGRYQEQPWELSITGGSIRGLLQREPGWQVQVNAGVSGMNVEMQTRLTEGARETFLSIDGENLDTLSPVAGVTLPPWGPYGLRGRLVRTENALGLQDFRLSVGESAMVGAVDLRLVDDIPRLDVRLVSEHLQLNDFDLETADSPRTPDTAVAQSDAGAEGAEGAEGEEGEEGAEDAADQRSADASDDFDIEALLAVEVLDRFRLQLDLAFDEVMSGDDRLGAGELRFTAGGDKASLDRWTISLPKGDIEMAAQVVSLNPGFQLGLNIDVENFDYGILARRADPESDLQGQIYLKVDLQSTTPHLDDAMAHGNGSVDFAVWPQAFKSGVFDLWAVGLISAAVSQYESESVINCLVARFALEQGVMRERELMIDTSKMRVLGDAVIDFPAETVDLMLKPRAKQRHFVSAATPVIIKGDFEHFEPNIRSSDIAFSVARSGYNIVLLGVPLLFHKTLEADGSEECRRAMSQDQPLERGQKAKQS